MNVEKGWLFKLGVWEATIFLKKILAMFDVLEFHT